MITHIQVIEQLYDKIKATFIAIGAFPPLISELYQSSSWHYCESIERKHKGKIGYICSYLYSKDTPRVRIVVHNFTQGGQSIIFDSTNFTKDLYTQKLDYHPRVNRNKACIRANILDHKKKEQQETKKKHHNFLRYLNTWENGDTNISSHPYIKKKGITRMKDLRLIDSQRIAFPLVDLQRKPHGIQIIDQYGGKCIYGKKKGYFAPIGSIESASRIYFCEGYATASAICNLILRTQKKRVPFCVIAAIDAKNMESVIKHFKEALKNKTFIICPDNDFSKIKKRKNNIGLLSGYNAAISIHCEIKAIPQDTFRGSDWCDAWLESPQKAMKCFSQMNKINRYNYAFERLLCFSEGNHSVSLKKACAYALHVASTLYPAKLSERDLLENLLTHTKHTKIGKNTVRWWWYKIKKKLFAQAQRAKSISRIQDEQVSIITIASIHQVHKKIQTLKEQHPQAIFITNMPMGTGKTKDFIQPEFMASNIKGNVPVIITPTRSLTKGVSQRLSSSHYIEDIDRLFIPNRTNEKKSFGYSIPDSLAITINSIISPQFEKFLQYSKAIFIDEYTQVLRSITSGTVEINLKQNTEMKLASLIIQSDYTYIADADFNQIALDQLKAITSNRPIFVFRSGESNEIQGINKNNQNNKSSEYRYYQDTDSNFTHKYLLSDIEKAVACKQKIYITSDSKTQLKTITQALEPLKVSVIMINADNANFPEQRLFLNNPNTYIKEKKPQVVLVSPCVQSGISIEVDYFDRCFGSYSGIVSPVVFAQMLHRVRSQKVFELALPNCTGRMISRDSEDAVALLTQAYAAHIIRNGGSSQISYDPQTKNHTIGKVSIVSNGHNITIEGDSDYARYEVLSAQIQALDRQQLNHAGNFLLIQALARGVTLTPINIDITQSEKKKIKGEHNKIKDIMKQLYVKKVLNAQTINQKEYEKTTFSHHINSERDFFEAARFNIAQDLKKKSDTLTKEDVEFYQNNGCQYVANFQALCKGISKAREDDIYDYKRGVAKTNSKWCESKVILLSLIFHELQLDTRSGRGNYTQEQAIIARNIIKENQELVRYVTFKLKLNVNSHLSDIAFINKIIKRLLGLRTTSTQIRKNTIRHRQYALNEIDMIRLQKYHYLEFSYQMLKGNSHSKSI